MIITPGKAQWSPRSAPERLLPLCLLSWFFLTSSSAAISSYMPSLRPVALAFEE